MKKSKIVGIGLLALSIASCGHKKRNHIPFSQYNNNPNYYINNGINPDDYQEVDNGQPFIVDAYYILNNGIIMPHPIYIYHSNGYRGSFWHGQSTSAGYRASAGGRVTSMSHSTASSVSRGGFGSSGGHAGA